MYLLRKFLTGNQHASHRYAHQQLTSVSFHPRLNHGKYSQVLQTAVVVSKLIENWLNLMMRWTPPRRMGTSSSSTVVTQQLFVMSGIADLGKLHQSAFCNIIMVFLLLIIKLLIIWFAQWPNVGHKSEKKNAIQECYSTSF